MVRRLRVRIETTGTKEAATHGIAAGGVFVDDARVLLNRTTLDGIKAGERAPDLATLFGLETKPFKQRVRRLKEHGLTESLKVGYHLSPRGASYLARLRDGS